MMCTNLDHASQIMQTEFLYCSNIYDTAFLRCNLRKPNWIKGVRSWLHERCLSARLSTCIIPIIAMIFQTGWQPVPAVLQPPEAGTVRHQAFCQVREASGKYQLWMTFQ